MKILAVIGAGEFQISGIKKAKEFGYYVISFDGNIDAFGKKFSNEFYHIDIKDYESIINILEKYKENLISSICFSTETALRTVAEINKYFKLPGLTPETVKIANNKFRQRECIKKSGLKYPNYQKIKKTEEMIDLKFPIIVKPVDNAGSRGISVVRVEKDLNKAVQNSFINSVYDNEIIVEEMIEGVEFTVEAIIIKGEIFILGISEKRKPLNNKTVSIELFYYSPIVKKYYSKISHDVKIFLSKCGFENVITHTELIISNADKNVYIIETSTRSGGFGVFDKVLPFVSGIDVVGVTIQANNGLNPVVKEIKQNPCILRFFTANKGRLDKISIDKDITKKLSDVEYGFYIKPGDYIKEINTDGSRPGYIISYGKNWEEVFNKANILEYAIRFEILE